MSRPRRADRRRLLLSAALALLLAAPFAARAAETAPHHLAIQVDSDDPAVMNLALNNARNAAEHYAALGEDIQIEIVTYGPGLHMLRADTSPVKDRLKALKESLPDTVFSACGNTKRGMEKAEGKDVPLVPEARIVPAGVVRLMELQEQGWAYIRP